MCVGEKRYWKIIMYQFLFLLVIVGALNWGLTALDYNVVDKLNTGLNGLVNTNTYLDKIIYGAVAIAAIILALKRDSWLPFLGYTVMPSSLIPLKQNKGDISVTVQVRPNAKVAYWATSPNKKSETPDVRTAYGDYSNSGVVMADKNGKATLVVAKGTSYIVPSGVEIARHVHYRELTDEWDMMKPIKTVDY